MSGWARLTKRPTLAFDLYAVVRSDANAYYTPAGHSVMAMMSLEANSPGRLERRIVNLAAAVPTSRIRIKPSQEPESFIEMTN